jgi:hypothetical protein
VSLSLAIDPETRDILFDEDNQVVYDQSPAPELILAISVPVGSFHGDPDQGSRVPGMVSGGEAVFQPESAVERAARDALARLEEQDLVRVMRVTYDPAERDLTIDSEDLVTPLHLGVGA